MSNRCNSLDRRKVAMKMCVKCNRINLDDAEECIGCGEKEFIRVIINAPKDE